MPSLRQVGQCALRVLGLNARSDTDSQMINDPEIYRTILQRLSTGVYFVDRDQRIVFWNRGAEEITGYLSQQALGHQMSENFLAHVGSENRKLEGDDLPLNAALRHGQEADTRATLRHKDGYPIKVRVRAVPLRDEFGKLLGAAEFFEPTDSTLWEDERKNMLAIHGCMDRATGALTREYTETQLHEHVETFQRHHIPFSVLLLQIDKLDDLKSRHGSGATAAVMKVVARTLLDALRPSDILGRWSETQYLIIAAECGQNEAPHVAERLRKTVDGADTEWWGDHLQITVSAGASSVNPGDESPAVVRRAEQALLKSITDGGDRSAFQYA